MTLDKVYANYVNKETHYSINNIFLIHRNNYMKFYFDINKKPKPKQS